MIRRVCVFLIREVYQKALRQLLPRSCRYTPSCSEYTAQAIELYGPLRGIGMGAWRILRCNPWFQGGEDPVERASAKDVTLERSTGSPSHHSRNSIALEIRRRIPPLRRKVPPRRANFL